MALPLGLLLAACLAAARAQSALDGTFTLVNTASSTRIFASPQTGFALARPSEPVYRDQLWKLAEQDEGRYAIVNYANGLRMVAKAGSSGDADFFVTDAGPVYQDQKWFFEVKADGSYAITNAKSERRIIVVSDARGPQISAPPTPPGRELPGEGWWLINQDRDDSARLAVELKTARQEAELYRHDLQRLLGRVQEAEGTKDAVFSQLATLRSEAASWMRDLQMAQLLNAKLVAEQSASELAASKLSLELALSQNETKILANELRAREAELVAVLSDLNETKTWLGELESSRSVLDDFGHMPLPVCSVAIAILALAVSICMRPKRKVPILKGTSGDDEEDCVDQTGSVVGQLGHDFGYQVIHRTVDRETERLIKIQCPGVAHADVEVNLIFNGCDVAIRRRACCGTEETSWKKRFRFKTFDGLFEFKEDQMQLEHGYLKLVFRAYTFRSRLIRFPHHFSLAESDVDQSWEYPDYDDIGHSYEGVSWLEPAAAALEASPSKSHRDTESTASTQRDP